MKYSGGCHCGAVRYDVEADLGKVMECNCSHCSVKGFLLAFVPKENFTLRSGQNNLTEYRFNKKAIKHLFCKTCGVQSFGESDGEPMMAINARCLDGVDASGLTVTQVNGKDF